MLKKLSDLKKLNFIRLLNLQKVETQMLYLVSIAVFVVLNLLLISFAWRADFSLGKAYTLSTSTKKMLKGLDDLVTVRFFASSELPTKLIPLKNQATDLLGEYKKEAGGKITVKILDPKKDPEALNQAREVGIPELQFSQLERDKYAVSTAYFGVSLSYGNKKEAIPQLTDIESLEYNLTAAIYKLIRKETTKIGIMGQTPVFNQSEDQLSSLKKILQQQFMFDFLDVSTRSATKEIDSSYKAVLVFDDGKKQYDNKEIDALSTYLAAGGKTIVFADSVWVSDNLTTLSANHNLFSLLSDWGLVLQNNLVLSTSSELVNFGNNFVTFLSPYPFWVKTDGFNSQAGYFSNIRQITYPWVSSVEVEKKDGFDVRSLVKTSKRSWEQKDNFILSPETLPQPKQSDFKEFVVTAESKSKDGGIMVLVPSSRFVLERYLGKNSGNLELVLNVLNDLASGGALSGIRQRALNVYPIPDIPDAQKDLFKYANILLLPSLLVIYAVVRLAKRK